MLEIALPPIGAQIKVRADGIEVDGTVIGHDEKDGKPIIDYLGSCKLASGQLSQPTTRWAWVSQLVDLKEREQSRHRELEQGDQKTVAAANIEKFRVLATAIGNTSRVLADFDRQDSSEARCLAEIAHQRSWYEFTVLVRDSYPWQEGQEYEARVQNALEARNSLERTVLVAEGLYPGISEGKPLLESQERCRPRA